MTATATATRVSTGYRPRRHQDEVHRARRRFSVVVCHRRFGKTVMAINELIHEALLCPRERPRFAYIAPLYRQAKAAAWDYLKAYTAAIPGREVHESELRVTLPGDRQVRLYGADNPDALRGIYLDGVVLDEFAQMSPRAWSEVIRPVLADRKGWALFIGTPMGHNAFWDIYEFARTTDQPDWWAASYRAAETGVIDADELAAARATMGEDEYAQEFECSFEAAIKGAYYGREMAAAEAEGRVTALPCDPAAPVWTAWDIGIGDATAIWFVQLIGSRIHVVDYLEASGEGLAFYAKAVKERAYVYAGHYVPHDAAAKEWGSGRTREEMARSLGLRFEIVANVAIDDGINAVRAILPRCVFDRAKCGQGLEALKQYRKDFDERLMTFRDRPRHDWASHGADAFRYLALGIRDRYLPPPPRWANTFAEHLVHHDRARGRADHRRI